MIIKYIEIQEGYYEGYEDPIITEEVIIDIYYTIKNLIENDEDIFMTNLIPIPLLCNDNIERNFLVSIMYIPVSIPDQNNNLHRWFESNIENDLTIAPIFILVNPENKRAYKYMLDQDKSNIINLRDIIKERNGNNE